MKLRPLSALMALTILQNGYANTNVNTEEKPDSCLTKDAYEEVWLSDYKSNLADTLAKTSQNSMAFYDDLMLKSITGYGTGASSSANTENNDPMTNIVQKFPKDSSYDKMMDYQKAIISIEQCVANIEDNKEFIKNAYGERKKTKLEEKMSINCKYSDQNDLLSSIKNKQLASSNFRFPNDIDVEGSVEAITARNINIFKSLHQDLTNQLNKLKTAVIEGINKTYSQSLPDDFNQSILSTNKISDKKVVTDTFSAFTDIIKTSNDNFPVTAINGNEIIINGRIGYINDYDQSLTINDQQEFEQFRAIKKRQVENIKQEVYPKIKSLGILKQSAVSGLATIIKERYTSTNSPSELSALADAIDASLNPNTTDKSKPTETLLKIRESLALSNKLAYMRYLALEKTQLSLTAIQIAQLKTIADKIKELNDGLEKNILFYEIGDQLSNSIGEGPSIISAE